MNDFILNASNKFGKLKNLSTLKNPMNPFFDGEDKYVAYKRVILAKFPNMKTLDGASLDQSTMNKQNYQVNQYDEKKY